MPSVPDARLPDGAIPAATLVIMRPSDSGGADAMRCIMRTPALAVDDEIMVEGKVPSSDELEQLLG